MTARKTKLDDSARAEGLADVAAVARLIGDPTRLAMLDALVEERDLPATELARRVGVSPSTASTHLARLADARLIAVKRQGRQRRYRLAGAPVAAAVEALTALAPLRAVKSLREATKAQQLREGRTCYDHLAGRLGVELTRALITRRLLRRVNGSYLITRRGEQTFSELGIDIAPLRREARCFAFPCLDWSERREHLACALGAALAARLFALGWVVRIGAGRGAALTNVGRSELAARFGLMLPPQQRQR